MPAHILVRIVCQAKQDKPCLIWGHLVGEQRDRSSRRRLNSQEVLELLYDSLIGVILHRVLAIFLLPRTERVTMDFGAKGPLAGIRMQNGEQQEHADAEKAEAQKPFSVQGHASLPFTSARPWVPETARGRFSIRRRTPGSE